MPTILVHGLGQSPSAWENVACRLNDNDILIPELKDLIGSGTWQELHDNFAEWLGEPKEPVCICGLSLGSVLALSYAAEYPEHVRSMLLIAPQFRMPKALLGFQALMFRMMPEKSFASAGLSKKQFISLTLDMAKLDFTPVLKNLSCPIITACGEKDNANFKAAVRLAELLPNGEFEAIPGSGHEANFDAPEFIAGLISRIQTRG